MSDINIAVENKKPTVRPLIGDNEQQLALTVGSANIPMLERTTPEHTRKKDGVSKVVPAKIDYIADYSNPSVFLLAATLALGAASQEDKPLLTERIFSSWVNDSIEKGNVPNPNIPGEFQWDETVAAKNLCLARAARKSGQSIEDMRADRNELNNVLVPILEICIASEGDNDKVNWDEVAKLTGTKFTDIEALVEWRISAKQRLNALQLAIRTKEEAMEKAKASRAEKKKANKKSAVEEAAA
jgi:hypothetical protein